MYVPLNAAIIVQIYSNSKSDSVLPHTLTELYTQLCLTILNRYLDVHHPAVTAAKFEDLPSDLYSQFLKLCEVAFEGMENEAVIFNLHSAFNHFGFLDAVSALYGGGETSYNFLHLTLQEFLAAYHISQLGDRGQELFKGPRRVRWNVVWRFVAGLTKFKHLTVVDMNSKCIAGTSSDRFDISGFFIECLFEAKTIEYFNSSIRAIPSFRIHVHSGVSAFVMYALGYCIANIHTGKPWLLNMTSVRADMFGLFMSGLKTNVPCVGIIKEVSLVYDCEVSLANIRFCFPRLDRLTIIHTKQIAWDDPLTFSNSLTELVMYGIPLDPNFVLLLLQQLCHSNVTLLGITSTGFCEHFRKSRRDFYPALEKLTNPSFGRLRTLKFGGDKCSNEDSVPIGENDSDVLANAAPDDDLVGLVSSPSSLKSLTLDRVHSSLFPLKSNTCLTKISIYPPCSERYSQLQILGVIDIVKYNKTLQHLAVSNRIGASNINPLKNIARAVIDVNTTLQSVKLSVKLTAVGHFSNHATLSKYMATHHKELTVDPQITWSITPFSLQWLV